MSFLWFAAESKKSEIVFTVYSSYDLNAKQLNLLQKMFKYNVSALKSTLAQTNDTNAGVNSFAPFLHNFFSDITHFNTTLPFQAWRYLDISTAWFIFQLHFRCSFKLLQSLKQRQSFV